MDVKQLTDEEWIEYFYSDWERVTGETRPADYKERAYRVLNGKRKTVQNQFEGITQCITGE